jgi:predicted phage-related endonuclease
METNVEIVKPDMVTLNAKVESFIALKNQIAELTKRLDSQKAELRAYVTGGDAKLTVGDHSISVKTCTRSAVDTKALQAAHPKLAEKFMKTTTYESVLIK